NAEIAMKLDDENDEILGVYTCTEDEDVPVTAESDQGIRYHVTDVPLYQSRDSAGERGMSVNNGDHVSSMAILDHVEATPAERSAYLKRSASERRLATGEDEDIALTNEDVGEDADLNDERYEELKAREQFVLTVSEYGYGKRSSS